MNNIKAIEPRPPKEVMRLKRMGAAHPTRLSFLRVMLNRMILENWKFDRPIWCLNEEGVGYAVYRAIGPARTYSLVAFSHNIPDHMRSDRVIATAWDATFTLFDGTPTEADLSRLSRNVPYQEAGRILASELSLSRANRSVRLFRYVVACLAAGQQPDVQEIEDVGYLMRTTAVYGSGKFGAADYRDLRARPEMAAPFQAEMLSVWLIRQFSVDVVEHMAFCQGGDSAVKLAPHIKHILGVGNSTGLGMAPFIVRHQILLNNWVESREQALAAVRSLPSVSLQKTRSLQVAFSQFRLNVCKWKTKHDLQVGKLNDLQDDIEKIGDRLKIFPGTSPLPWDELWQWGEQTLTCEGQEALLALLLEPHGELIDSLDSLMSADEEAEFLIDGKMSVKELKDILVTKYDWALAIDFSVPESHSRFWYVSEEKLEPRFGQRTQEDEFSKEQPLCIGRLASSLDEALKPWPQDASIASFLRELPEHRYMVRRAQIANRHPYSEIQDNLIADDLIPLDMLRFKLAFLGASHFDPKSDKWLRICLFQGAAYPLDLTPQEISL